MTGAPSNCMLIEVTLDVSTFIAPTNGQIRLHALLDRSVLELYVNDGERVATTVYFMEKPELRLSAVNGTVTVQNLSAFFDEEYLAIKKETR